ncbi:MULTISPECIES: BREX system Lon protease-like protein BrxL [unclassified Bradyrhizobium]|uniref:BREX system Lon protease-like protein BrxL n=1 Tax=unclassified Bradyrhizobium TaxID=2631580 RepID=UPI001CD4AC5F|nr:MULTISPECIES: BREX system Lon protease-like protein BrxL [unclassified Bradyrhizobium]MCA1398426.1 BREX system Lon protease-like protein BrxL [Bradyrhizobium sp. BRP56]UWU92689.1 BREX system Lon protease-like protein BrxL [Bradyrhizobium sp. CB1015]
MTALDDKINECFPGLVVRKDLVKAVKGNAIVPSYVLEFLLGQYCATNDEASIQSGIETVKEILRKHYVHRNEAGLIRSNIREKGRWKVIDKISVDLNTDKDAYEATFANLGIKKVIIDSDTVKAHPKLLVSGVWCIADVEYEHSEDKNVEPWILGSIKPIQLSKFDYDAFLKARAGFTTDEWIDLLFQTVGFNPEMFGRRSKLLQLMRLVPFVERNYNLIELGPKGTGKSHIFSEFSPHGILISGGEVTVPKLFVNNSSGKIGLVGYWDVVAFDEFAGRQKRVDKALVDIMKNYMANKSFSRGVETLGAEASMVFVGNTKHNVPYMLKHTDLFDELPEKYYDSAFIDRLHAYVPGWEIDVIRGEMFASGYGFVVDYLAEILRHMRNDDYSNRYQGLFTISSDISTRDRDGVNKTFSGMMKLLFPADNAAEAEVEEILHLAVEGRKRVKDQLLRIDSTYPETDFSFTARDGRKVSVTTLEETEYPSYYYRKRAADQENTTPAADETNGPLAPAMLAPREIEVAPVRPREGHKIFIENQKGVAFADLFWPWIDGATKVVITDPYIRMFHQLRNLMEFVEMIALRKAPEDELSVHLITCVDENHPEKQQSNLLAVEAAGAAAGIKFTWEYDGTNTIHARHITSDTGWKISLDRGLDIYQKFEMNDAFSLTNRLQVFRQVKAFEITYLKIAS